MGSSLSPAVAFWNQRIGCWILDLPKLLDGSQLKKHQNPWDFALWCISTSPLGSWTGVRWSEQPIAQPWVCGSQNPPYLPRKKKRVFPCLWCFCWVIFPVVNRIVKYLVQLELWDDLDLSWHPGTQGPKYVWIFCPNKIAPQPGPLFGGYPSFPDLLSRRGAASPRLLLGSALELKMFHGFFQYQRASI